MLAPRQSSPRNSFQDKLTNLDHEAHKGEGVVVQHDAADVADHLGHAAQDHADHEAPALPPDAEEDVDEADDGEEGEEGDVGGQVGTVGVDGPLDRAVVEVTGGVGAKGLVLVGVGKHLAAVRHGFPVEEEVVVVFDYGVGSWGS